MSPRFSPARGAPRWKRRGCTWRISRPIRRGRPGFSPSSAFGSGEPTASSRVGPCRRDSTRSSPRRPPGPGTRNGRGRSSKRRSPDSPPSAEYYALVLDYAEFHRKQGETAAATAILEKLLADAPPAFRSEARFLRARVEWKAGRLAEARKEFLAIAEGDALPGTADRARYLAAWIAEDEGDIAGATESFGRLRGARDDSIRQESLFRYAYGLYRTGRFNEAVVAFEAGETGGGGTVERARHRYWKTRALRDSGKEAEAAPILSELGGDAFAGIYALFAVSDRGQRRRSGSSTPPPTARRRRAARSANVSGRVSGMRTGGRPTPRRSDGRSG